MSLRSDLGKVRGLGSAKQGTSHWWMQRITAVALVPLAIWFVITASGLVGIDQAGFKAWLNEPGHMLMLILFIGALFYHMQLGLQVVIEDYVNGEGCKLFSQLAVTLGCSVIAVASLFAVLKIAL